MANIEGSAGKYPRINAILGMVFEAFGACVLTFAGIYVVISQALHPGAHPAQSIGTAFGATLAVQFYIWHSTGCHLNPGITLMLALMGKFPWMFVPFYWAGQIAGGFAAAELTKWHFGTPGVTVAHLGAAVPGPHVSAKVQVFVAGVSALLFGFSVAMSVAHKAAFKVMGGPVIGAALGAGVAIALPYTGGGLNLARELGPAVLSGTGAPLPYIVEMVGFVLAAPLALLFFVVKNPGELEY